MNNYSNLSNIPNNNHYDQQYKHELLPVASNLEMLMSIISIMIVIMIMIVLIILCNYDDCFDCDDYEHNYDY